MTHNELRLALQSYRFAAHDMLLYLDTHPDDEKAFALFKSLTKKANELQNAYIEKCGPLTAASAAKFDEFRWLECPWPWEKGGNA
ncbi:MAG: spore coat protein CotJB [Clostridia bacterium]|nr:spore coat protein CotJB [Clostridia bacterium]